MDAGWTEEPPSARGAVRERWDSLQALAQLADDFAADAAGQGALPSTLREFVEHLVERAAAQHAPAVEGVTLTTMHAAKGLEWDAVFIVGLSEGLVPISMAETDEAVSEERRLLYVAITRAREHLTLSYAMSRKEGGRSHRKRTRFLEKWWPDVRQAPTRRASTSSKLADLDVEQLRLFDSLKAWRLEIAKADNKPAFTVLVDSSLVQIATTRPGTLRELANVNGVGASKLEKYGLQILEVVATH
jgi:DNA helicase-2/ATP-dependent DNA helicase PcrA